MANDQKAPSFLLLPPTFHRLRWRIAGLSGGTDFRPVNRANCTVAGEVGDWREVGEITSFVFVTGGFVPFSGFGKLGIRWRSGLL